MAANQRAKAAGFSQDSELTSGQANTMDTNAARAVARTGTLSGARHLPLSLRGYYGVKGVVCATSGIPYIVCTTATGEELATFDLVGLPPRHAVASVGLTIKTGLGANHAAEPEVKPRLVAFSLTGAGVKTVLGSAALTWTSTAAYQTTQELLVTLSAAVTVTSTTAYLAQYRNEGGSSAVGSVSLYRLRAYVNCDTASGGADFTFWV